MAKNLLQDMFIRKDGQQGKTPVPSVNRFEMLKSTPSQSAAPEPAKESVPIKIYTPPEEKVVPVKTPEPVNYEPKYSPFETKFATINDAGSDLQGGGKSRYTLWFVALASALFLVFALSYLF